MLDKIMSLIQEWNSNPVPPESKVTKKARAEQLKETETPGTAIVKRPRYVKKMTDALQSETSMSYNECHMLARRSDSICFLESGASHATYRHYVATVIKNIYEVKHHILDVSPLFWHKMIPELCYWEKNIKKKRRTFENSNKEQCQSSYRGGGDCASCGEKGTVETRLLQTRSADEPMSNYTYCWGCGKRTKY